MLCNPRVPWCAKALAILVAGYALSPIDLIPDFIPVIGYLDGAIIVPLGAIAVVRLIPPEIMAENRELAAAAQDRPVNRRAAAIIIAIWLAGFAVCARLLYSHFRSVLVGVVNPEPTALNAAELKWRLTEVGAA